MPHGRDESRTDIDPDSRWGRLLTYWLLFMSWSHSYAAPSFPLQQTIVLSTGAICVLAGLTLGVMTLVRRPAAGRDA